VGAERNGFSAPRAGNRQVVETLAQSKSPFAGYSEDEPLAAYAAMTAFFNAGMAIALVPRDVAADCQTASASAMSRPWLLQRTRSPGS